MTALLAGSLGVLWNAPAPTIDSFPSPSPVRALIPDGPALVALVSGGAYRIERGPDGAATAAWTGKPPAGEPLLSARLGACVYRPSEEGVIEECGGAAVTRPVGGFPAVAVAAHRGSLYVGTLGAGLRILGRPGAIPGLPTSITALAPFGAGLIIGTEEGLFIYEDGAPRSITPQGPRHSHIAALEKGGGQLWVATFDRGLSAYDGSQWRHWGDADGLPSAWLNDLAWDGEKLWGATDKGVFWVRDGRVEVPAPAALRQPTAALAVNGGSVFAAQARRVLAWRAGRLEVLPTPEAHPQHLASDGKTIWLGGLDGLYRIENGTVRHFRAIDGALPDDWTTALAISGRRLFVGTYDAGLAVLEPGSPRAEVKIKTAWVNPGALTADKDRIAAGTLGDGLWLKQDGGWRRLRRRHGLPSDDVTAVLFDGDDLWVGTRAGLARVRAVR